MRDTRVLQAFFATLESDGLRISVRDQTRMRALFATRNHWDLNTVRVALRSLLTHDPHQRASFDRHFHHFFPANDDHATIPTAQLRRVLEDLRNLPPDAPTPETLEPHSTPPKDIAHKPPRHGRRKRVWNLCRHPGFIVACCLVVVLGVVVWRFRPEPAPTKTPKLPVFDPPSIVLERPAEGDQATEEVTLTNPDDKTSYVIESLTAADTDTAVVELSLEPANLPHQLSPGDALKILVTVKARQWDTPWNTSVQVRIQGVDHPVQLPVIGAQTRPEWTPDPWRDLGVETRLVASMTPLDPDRRWVGWLIAGLACVAGAAGYYAWLYRWRQLDLTPVADPKLDAPGQGFSIASIGGARQPVVRQRRTSRLADMLGQVHTEDVAQRLDLPRTIERTIRAGGFPDFAWQRERERSQGPGTGQVASFRSARQQENRHEPRRGSPSFCLLLAQRRALSRPAAHASGQPARGRTGAPVARSGDSPR